MSKEGTQQIRQDVTDRMIAALQAGTVPWQRPWSGAGPAGLPCSLSTKKRYRGVNVWLLGLTATERGYRSPWWGTYNQVMALGGQVRKGQNHKNGCGSVRIILSKQVPKGTDDDGNPITFSFLATFSVFNAEQCDGLPGWCYPSIEDRGGQGVLESPETVHKAYLARRGAPSFRYAGDKAYYTPATDEITIPHPESFDSPASRYATIFHEDAHSTGHASRLGRPGIENLDHFGSGQYAEEELVAEMTAAMLCAVTGLSTTGLFTNAAAYIASWLRKLGEDPKLVIKASSAASKALDYILESGSASSQG